MDSASRCIRLFLRSSIAIVGVLGSVVLHAAEVPSFPADPVAWIHSGPLTSEGLRGKGIVLYFFEEECPRCKERWPKLLDSAKEFEGQPVMFIAVNSGNDRGTVERYAREVKLTWPIIVDVNREFERACDVKEISLLNIYQTRIVMADGSLHVGDSTNFEATANRTLSEAKWKIDPMDLPEALKPAWLAVETGNYRGVQLALKKHLGSNKQDVKETAQKLMEVVEQDLDQQVKSMEEAQSSGNSWKAWQLSNSIPLRFQGMEMPKTLATMKKDLQKDPKVKAGQSALKTIEGARKPLLSGNPALKKKAVASLEQIVTDFPDTDIARQAQSLIDFATKPPEEK